jgi:hypothetical protein
VDKKNRRLAIGGAPKKALLFCIVFAPPSGEFRLGGLGHANLPHCLLVLSS